jgi:hypothetical protein
MNANVNVDNTSATFHADITSQNYLNLQNSTAEYICDLVSELSHLAFNARLDSLAYLLRIAQSEAERAAANTR